MALARQIQLTLLPENLPEIPGYSVFAANDASRAVSGDFYEFQGRDECDEQVIVIADVSGKGMAASLLAASFDALLMGPIEVGLPSDEICSKVSRRLFMKTPPERYVTAFIAALDPATDGSPTQRRPPGLLFRANGKVERLEANGMPLGLFPVVEYERMETTLAPGELLLLYTDGITEAANPKGDEFGLERLQAVAGSTQRAGGGNRGRDRGGRRGVRRRHALRRRPDDGPAAPRSLALCQETQTCEPGHGPRRVRGAALS
jgi:sigma-B regulation protein RsbU (phosphoserine phosphatase)